MTVCSALALAFIPTIVPRSLALWVSIGAGIGFVIGIGLVIYSRRLAKKEEKARKVQSLTIRKKNKEIDGILDTVEAMDNHLYSLLPHAKKKHIAAHPNLNKTIGDILQTTFSFARIWLWFHPYILWSNSLHGFERLSEFMDEKQLGLEQYRRDKTYGNLESELDKKLRLKSVGFRNAVYNFVALSYGFNSEILYFSILKETLIGSPLYAARTVRRLNKARPQVMGNMLTNLAVKLEECGK